MYALTHLLVESILWFLDFIPVSALRSLPLGQNVIDLLLQLAVVLLQLLHPVQVVLQAAVQGLQLLLVVLWERGGGGTAMGSGDRSGGGSDRSGVCLGLVAQDFAESLKVGHGRLDAPPPGSSEHAGAAVARHVC